jgi:hypothetical protein
MATSRIDNFATGARREMARQMMDLALVALVYLGIIGTFAAVSLVGCVIWLLIW